MAATELSRRIPIEQWKGFEGEDYFNTVITRPLELFSDESLIHTTVVHEIIGSQPGFFLGINAGTHGEEDTGVAAAESIAKMATYKLVKGAMAVSPRANPEGIRSRSRYVSYNGGEERDLNRGFTIHPDGSRIQRHGAALLNFFKNTYQKAKDRSTSLFQEQNLPREYPGAVIDIHTEDTLSGTNREKDLLPYFRIDPDDNDTHLAFTMKVAMLSKTPWVMEYEQKDYQEEELDKSLTAVLNRDLDIPSLTLEAGPGGAAFDRYVYISGEIIENIMGYFQMRWQDQPNVEGTFGKLTDYLSKIPSINYSDVPLRLADAFAADQNGNPIETEGELRLLEEITPGRFIKKGEPIGWIQDTFSLRSEPITIYAPFDGYVLSETTRNIRHTKGELAYMSAVPIKDDERLIRIYREQKALLETEGFSFN